MENEVRQPEESGKAEGFFDKIAKQQNWNPIRLVSAKLLHRGDSGGHDSPTVRWGEAEDDAEEELPAYRRYLNGLLQPPVLGVIGLLLLVTVGLVWITSLTAAPQPQPKTTSKAALAASPAAESATPATTATVPPQLASSKTGSAVGTAYPGPGSGMQTLPSQGTTSVGNPGAPTVPSPTPRPGLPPPPPPPPTPVFSGPGPAYPTVAPRPNTGPLPPVVATPRPQSPASIPPETAATAAASPPLTTAPTATVEPSATLPPSPTAIPTITPTPGPITVNVSVPALQGGSGMYKVIKARAGTIAGSWQATGSGTLQMFLYQGTPFGADSGVVSSPPGTSLAMSNVGSRVSIVPINVPTGTYTLYFLSTAVNPTGDSSGSITYTPDAPLVTTPAASSTPMTTATSTATNQATPTPTPTQGSGAAPTATATPMPPAPTASPYPGP